MEYLQKCYTFSNILFKYIFVSLAITVKATVPGTIHTDLLRNNVINDPYYRNNDILYKWIGQDKWTFTKKFSGNIFFILAIKICCSYNFFLCCYYREYCTFFTYLPVLKVSLFL